MKYPYCRPHAAGTIRYTAACDWPLLCCMAEYAGRVVLARFAGSLCSTYRSAGPSAGTDGPVQPLSKGRLVPGAAPRHRLAACGKRRAPAGPGWAGGRRRRTGAPAQAVLAASPPPTWPPIRSTCPCTDTQVSCLSACRARMGTGSHRCGCRCVIPSVQGPRPICVM